MLQRASIFSCVIALYIGIQFLLSDYGRRFTWENTTD
jgi:hypothetical protein